MIENCNAISSYKKASASSIITKDESSINSSALPLCLPCRHDHSALSSNNHSQINKLPCNGGTPVKLNPVSQLLPLISYLSSTVSVYCLQGMSPKAFYCLTPSDSSLKEISYGSYACSSHLTFCLRKNISLRFQKVN